MSSDTLNRTQAKRQILELMLEGDIDPQTAISERSLAERTGLGRTPVREALRDLERDGLIGIEPKRGSFMRKLGLDNVREIFEVRFAMETMAASLAALRGPSTRLREIHRALSQIDKKDRTDQLQKQATELGHELHNEIIASAGNELLASQYAQVRLMIEVSLHLTRKRESTRFETTLKEHIAIAEAVLDGDTSKSQAAMRDHLKNGYTFRMRALTEFPDFKINLELGD